MYILYILAEIDERDVVWKMCAVLAGALSFFLLELLLHSCTARFGHTHSHGVSAIKLLIL